MSEDFNVPGFCDCGGLLTGKIGARKLVCVKCYNEYSLRKEK